MIDRIYLLAIRFAAPFINDSDVNLPNSVRRDPDFVKSRFQTGLEITFGALGAIAVLIITIAALQYVLSGGDSAKIAKAKDTIIYALVGLVVAVAAYAIVRFVLKGVF